MERGHRALAFGVHAEVTPQTRQQGCRTPNLAVYAFQVSFDGDVRAERVRANSLQWREVQIRRDGEGDARFACYFRRVKEKQFVNDSRREGRAIQRGASFEKDAENLSAAEFGENGSKIDPSHPRNSPDDLDASFFQSSNSPRMGILLRNDEKIILHRLHNPGMRRDRQPPIQNNS